MIKIYIFSDSHKHFEKPIEVYNRRLGKKCKIIKLKPSKKNTPKEVIDEETARLNDKIATEKGYKIILAPQGNNLNTFEFHDLIEKRKMDYGEIIFVIGGAYGLDYEKIQKKHLDISLGKHIMPHGLALCVLLEQIYRSEQIAKGGKYHK